MKIDKRKMLGNIAQSTIWLSIQSARFGAQLSELAGMSLLMGGYGFDSAFRLYQDWSLKAEQENVLAKINYREENVEYKKSNDFTRIQALLAKYKKAIKNSLMIQQGHIKQLEQVNFARLTQELERNIGQYNSFLWQYHTFVTSGIASGLTLDLLYLLLDYGIAPLGSTIILGFCLLNQIKCWAVDIHDYMNTLAQCEKKIDCLMQLNFKQDLGAINRELVQCGLAPLFSLQKKGEYIMQEINVIAEEKQTATHKIMAHSYWYSFMLTGMSCLFFCANPIIGLGVFGSGLMTYALLKWLQPEPKVQEKSLSRPFAQIVRRAHEFCEIPNLSHDRALAF